ncbi:MAG: hypothetical protein HOJ30_10705 [Halieaceae bacterium]|jgi:hypothetical protein|nr:hypothetical protein MGP2080_12307 [marine gamma proteobacterium HTCC2080]MBT3459010.1 hypothetical protein [Halieaceae bacterium]MBT5208775.1 hypothetical protein [Halieaceae bacterium]MBT6334233.1 hypothetical protein [Halieaceae bacterium]MBT7340849.1 hypothetical protein [Halieaceae bacterium]
MTTALLEIVDLGDGEIVLQRAEEEGVEPLVSIQFSAEASAYLMENNLEVAKAMIQAGIQAAARLAEMSSVEVDAEAAESKKAAGGRTVH